MRALVVLLAVGCTHQIGPVEPWDALTYRFYDMTTLDDKTIYGHHIVSDNAEVLVGLPIEVEGVFAASCSKSTTPLGHDPDAEKFPDKTVPCKKQKTDVAIHCVGACTIRDQLVTPTAPGKLTVQVTLTSRETKEQKQVVHELVAVAPEDFEIGCAQRFLASESDKVCVATREPIHVRIKAGTKSFTAPIMANGRPIEASRDGAELSLAQVVGSAPTDFAPAPGAYKVELVFGPLRHTVNFEVE